jgi:hypothetical protein
MNLKDGLLDGPIGKLQHSLIGLKPSTKIYSKWTKKIALY